MRPIDLTVRRAWNGGKLLFLVGPGGVGKSALGRSLAPKLGRTLVDLDETFLVRIGDIGGFIRDQGYAAYKAANVKLASVLADEATRPLVLVMSPGFLIGDNPPETLAGNFALLARGYSVSLLPSSDIESTVATIVSRQMTRPFNVGIAKEEAKARARFETYKAAGDILVCSIASPDAMAEALMPHLLD